MFTGSLAQQFCQWRRCLSDQATDSKLSGSTLGVHGWQPGLLSRAAVVLGTGDPLAACGRQASV